MELWINTGAMGLAVPGAASGPWHSQSIAHKATNAWEKPERAKANNGEGLGGLVTVLPMSGPFSAQHLVSNSQKECGITHQKVKP